MRLAALAFALLATSPASASTDVPWPIAACKPNAIAVDGPVAYLATGTQRGSFDAAGGADTLSVRWRSVAGR